MNVIKFISRIEMDGLHLYETLAEETDNKDYRVLFGLLADTQRKHLASLEVLEGSLTNSEAESEAAERARNISNGFRRLLDRRILIDELKKDPDAFYHIVKAEEENIHLFEGMAAAEHNLTAKNVLKNTVSEERKHLTQIENIYEFIENPRTYLEWGEFSNLRTL